MFRLFNCNLVVVHVFLCVCISLFHYQFIFSCFPSINTLQSLVIQILQFVSDTIVVLFISVTVEF